MINKIVVACCDVEIQNIVKETVSSVIGDKNVIICKSIFEIHNAIKYKNDIAIIFDKYFLGFVISYELVRIHYLNDKVLTYFVDLDDVSHYFAMRIHQLGVEGFIPNIENKEYFKKSVLQIQSGKKLFPASVTRSFDEDDYLLDREFISEITVTEMEIALYLSKGYCAKEICYRTGFKPGTVSRYTKRLKRKIGFYKPGDLELLCKRYFNQSAGGENDN
ncbi:MAG: hypothetical protein SO161_08535 [Treponema sp.]|nr:hypothetical protein [Treponema sp.]